MQEAILLDGYAVKPSLLEKVPTLLEYPIRVRRFKSGQVVVRFREPIKELQFMAEGCAKVYSVMDNGRAALHSMFQGFEVIGDLELLRGYPEATTDIQAVTDVVLLTIPLERCREALLADAYMLRVLGEELARKLERSSRQATQNMLYSLSVRLAAYILFAARDGLFSENLLHVSEHMATSYRHLLRTIKAFCECGALRRVGQGQYAIDAEKLVRESANLLWTE